MGFPLQHRALACALGAGLFGSACGRSVSEVLPPPPAAEPAGATVTAVGAPDAPASVEIPTSDGGLVHADVYGAGERAVVLAHGGRYAKASWEPQARALAAAGHRVLALDFRGYGASRGPGMEDPLSAPLALDVLAAVRWLRAQGATSVAVVGGSMGASAAGDAAIQAQPGEIDRVVLLAGTPSGPAERLAGRKLFLIARDDPGPGGRPRLTAFAACHAAAPEPKELVVLDGDAHAQALFASAEGPRALEEILRFLAAP